LAGQGRYAGLAPCGTALTGPQAEALSRAADLRQVGSSSRSTSVVPSATACTQSRCPEGTLPRSWNAVAQRLCGPPFTGIPSRYPPW
jgi:hypothetical protein